MFKAFLAPHKPVSSACGSGLVERTFHICHPASRTWNPFRTTTTLCSLEPPLIDLWFKLNLKVFLCLLHCVIAFLCIDLILHLNQGEKSWRFISNIVERADSKNMLYDCLCSYKKSFDFLASDIWMKKKPSDENWWWNRSIFLHYHSLHA